MPFLQGCAEFGLKHPEPAQYCLSPSKVSPANAILMSVRAPVGRLNFADQQYGIGRGLCAILPRTGQLNLSFAYHFLEASSETLQTESTGSTYDAVSTSDVLALPIVVPPFNEQTAIARFLDHMDNRIQRYIRAKERLIELLDEYKQALIHQAITGQIDVQTGRPYDEYKESGVEWLGRVPVAWRVPTLGKAATSIQTGPFGSQLHASDYEDGLTPVINPSHIREGRIVPDTSISINQTKVTELSRHCLCANDIIMARRGDLGRCAVVGDSEEGWICGTGSLRIRSARRIIKPRYLALILGAHGVKTTLGFLSVGATMPNLNEEIVSRLKIPLPPLNEQAAIVEFVSNIATSVDTARKRTTDQVSFVHVYRNRLIADVVTGKLDVRKAAASLPDSDTLKVASGPGDPPTGAMDYEPDKTLSTDSSAA